MEFPQGQNPIQFNQSQWTRAEKKNVKKEDAEVKPEPKIRSGNRERRIDLAKNAKGIGEMMSKANDLLSKVREQAPGSIDAAKGAINLWNEMACKALIDGKHSKSEKIQTVAREFQEILDHITKGPGNARSPRPSAEAVKASIDDLRQEARECFQNATNPKLDPKDSKKAMFQGDLIFDKIITLSQNSPPEMHKELVQFQNDFKTQHAQASNIFRTDRCILDLTMPGGNKKLILSQALKSINELPEGPSQQRKGMLRQVLLRNPELFVGQPQLLDNPQFAEIIDPRDYVAALMKKVPTTEGAERKALLKEIETRHNTLSKADKSRLPSLEAVSATPPKTTGFRAGLKSAVGYVTAASAIQKLNYPAGGIAIDDGKGLYTPESIKKSKLNDAIKFIKREMDFIKMEMENESPPNEGMLVSAPYTVGAGDIFNIQIDGLSNEEKQMAVKIACADLIANPELNEQKVNFLKTLVPEILASLKDDFSEGNMDQEAYIKKKSLYSTLEKTLPGFAAMIDSNFKPISHDHGVSNSQYHVTIAYDGKGHASLTKEEAKAHLDNHEQMDDLSHDLTHWPNLDVLHFDSIEAARKTFDSVSLARGFGSQPFAITKCISIKGEPYVMFMQSVDCCCGIIGTNGQLRPLINGGPIIMSDRTVNANKNKNMESTDGLLQHYRDFSQAIVKVKPGEEIISFSDGIGEFLTPDEFQTVLSNNQDRKLLGEELRITIISKGAQEPSEEPSELKTPDLVGNERTNRWHGGDPAHYDDTVLMLQVVPDRI